jgi:hypothetical protein
VLSCAKIRRFGSETPPPRRRPGVQPGNLGPSTGLSRESRPPPGQLP